MTDARESAFAALLAAERTAYAGRVELRVSEIVEHLAAGNLEGARRAAHTLRGSAGTYGFPSISDAAAEIEDTLGGGQDVDEAMLRRLRETTAEAKRLTQGSP